MRVFSSSGIPNHRNTSAQAAAPALRRGSSRANASSRAARSPRRSRAIPTPSSTSAATRSRARGGMAGVVSVVEVVGVLEGDPVAGADSWASASVVGASGAAGGGADLQRRAEQGSGLFVVQALELDQGRGWRLAQIAGLSSHHPLHPATSGQRGDGAQEVARARGALRPPRRSIRRPASAARRRPGSRSPRRTTLWLLGLPRRKSSSSIAGRSSWISE